MSDDDHICFVMLPLPPRSSHFLRFLLMVLVGVGPEWTDERMVVVVTVVASSAFPP